MKKKFQFLSILHSLFFILYSLFITLPSSFSQIPVSRYDSIPVIISAGDTLRNAWAGGINSAQFSEIDLNGDGLKDIFIFEKSGNIFKTFLNDGTAYHYAPEFQSAFPSGMTNIALLADYNCDGKEDIFTYTPGGMAVYKNNYSPLGGLSFSLETSQMKCYYGGGTGWANIYVGTLDLPALSDVDSDGDLDILNFDFNGGGLKYYRNFSMDSLVTCDSAGFPSYYYLADGCWGKFYEPINTNIATIPYSCKGPGGPPDTTLSGCACYATILAIDIDKDSDKDLILGGNSSKNLDRLTNGGDKFSAAMDTVQDIDYPSYSTPTNLTFPAPFYLDANHDSIKDLVVTTYNYFAEDTASVWLYRNTAATDSPFFVLEKRNFLQDEMIDLGSGSNPAFFDYNADGLMDIVAGNYGYYNTGTGQVDGKLALFQNTGTATNPKYNLITRDYANVSAENKNGLYPTFGDIDNDGDKDMFLGESTGRILFYKNTAGAGVTANFSFVNAFYDSIDAGNYAASQLVDLNRDGLLDFIIGERGGRLKYYQNTGTATNAYFSSVPTNDSLGYADVLPACCTGYAAPFIFESSPGNYAMLTGSESGKIYYYTNIDGNLNGTFTLTDSILTGEFRTSISMADINSDGKAEIVVGSYPGGMHILKTEFPVAISEKIAVDFSFDVFPNPNDGKFVVQITDLNRPARPAGGFADYRLQIYNILGEKIYNPSVIRHPSSVSIDLSNHPNGIYFLRLSSGEKTAVRKLVKM